MSPNNNSLCSLPPQSAAFAVKAAGNQLSGCTFISSFNPYVFPLSIILSFCDLVLLRFYILPTDSPLNFLYYIQPLPYQCSTMHSERPVWADRWLLASLAYRKPQPQPTLYTHDSAAVSSQTFWSQLFESFRFHLLNFRTLSNPVCHRSLALRLTLSRPRVITIFIFQILCFMWITRACKTRFVFILIRLTSDLAHGPYSFIFI